MGKVNPVLLDEWPLDAPTEEMREGRVAINSIIRRYNEVQRVLFMPAGPDEGFVLDVMFDIMRLFHLKVGCDEWDLDLEKMQNKLSEVRRAFYE